MGWVTIASQGRPVKLSLTWLSPNLCSTCWGSCWLVPCLDLVWLCLGSYLVCPGFARFGLSRSLVTFDLGVSLPLPCLSCSVAPALTIPGCPQASAKTTKSLNCRFASGNWKSPLRGLPERLQDSCPPSLQDPLLALRFLRAHLRDHLRSSAVLLLLITLVVDIERLVIRSWHPFLIVLVDFLLFLQGWGALRQTRKRGFEGLGQQVSGRKAVLEGRCHSPNRTPPLDQRSRFYAIVKCEGISVPVIYRSSASYWAAIRSFGGQ